MSERSFKRNPIVEELQSSGGNVNTPLPSIYSPAANFAVALFGGVYGIVIFAALSLRRLGRFSAETPLLIVILYVRTGFLFWSANMTPEGAVAGSLLDHRRYTHQQGRGKPRRDDEVAILRTQKEAESPQKDPPP